MSRRFRERARDERASIIVELTLVLPLLVLLVVGAVDLGGVMSASGQVAIAAQEGSRVGASLGVTPGADREILLATAAGLEDIPISDVETIVVFKADTPDAEVPPGCLTAFSKLMGGDETLSCVVYTAWRINEILADPTNNTWFDKRRCNPQWDWAWCAQSRNNVQTETTPPDNLGVYIELKHGTRSGLFVDDVTIKDSSISTIVPGAGS